MGGNKFIVVNFYCQQKLVIVSTDPRMIEGLKDKNLH